MSRKHSIWAISVFFLHIKGDSFSSILFLQICSDEMFSLCSQKAEMRCLLPKSLLDHGLFPPVSQKDENNRERKVDQIYNFSWSGQRKTPSYLNKLVFPENFMSALRTIAMKEDEYSEVSLLLEEVPYLCDNFLCICLLVCSFCFILVDCSSHFNCLSLWKMAFK